MILTKKKSYSLWLVKEKLSRSVSFRFFSGGSKTSPSSELISKLEPAEVAEVVEVSKITDSMLSCLQDPVIQSTLIFVGVVVVVVCWQQFALSAVIQGLLYTAPSQISVASVKVKKCLSISCMDPSDKDVKISVVFKAHGDNLVQYHDGKVTLNLEDFLARCVQDNNSIPQSLNEIIKSLDKEMPNLIAQFGSMPFKDQDCLITQVVIKKADYIYCLAFYPGF